MVTSYYELPLKAGEIYEATTTEERFELTNATDVVVEPSIMQNGEEIKIYKVDLSVEGSGEVSGINTYSVGEFAKVSAYPAEDSEFFGWYENGLLISNEKESRFCVKNDTILTAKFVQKTKTEIEKSEEEKIENVEKYYTIKKHAYKIIDEEKKTVSFVKTSSKWWRIPIICSAKNSHEN